MNAKDVSYQQVLKKEARWAIPHKGHVENAKSELSAADGKQKARTQGQKAPLEVRVQ